MKLLELTLPTTEENLALDETLLSTNDNSGHPREVLRLWENSTPAVILGRSSKVSEEINESFCSDNNILFLRRVSGGAAVTIGPGCLMYAVVLDYRLRPDLRMLDRAHEFVMLRMRSALQSIGLDVLYQGTCDLTLNDRKFSGNSLRCQRNSFLYHGTLLYDYPLDLLHHCLGTPPRQPKYRESRSHRDFVCNLPTDRPSLTDALINAWQTEGIYELEDMKTVQELAKTKYRDAKWNRKR